MSERELFDKGKRDDVVAVIVVEVGVEFGCSSRCCGGRGGGGGGGGSSSWMEVSSVSIEFSALA